MEIDLSQKKLIKAKFKAARTKKDLVEVLNYAKQMMYGEDCEPIRLKSLNYYANPNFCKKRYTRFTIPKKSGEDRIINAPVKGLKSILKVLNLVLQCVHVYNEQSIGFVPGKSILDGAKIHTKQNYVYNIDLENFFHSFDRSRVKTGLMKYGLGLNDEQEPMAFFIACLATHPFKIDGRLQNVLPQGSPASPTLTNILTKKLDRRLNGLAKKYSCKYSRYADDITFSCSKNIFKEIDFKKELKRIIETDQKLKIKKTKTRLLVNRGRKRQEVTGLVVNNKVNVKSSYVKEIRMLLYYWETYGFKKANSIFQSKNKFEKGKAKSANVDLKKVLAGKLEFLKMIRGEEDPRYLKLKSRYKSLIQVNKDDIEGESHNIFEGTNDVFTEEIDGELNDIFEGTNDVFTEEIDGELNDIFEGTNPSPHETPVILMKIGNSAEDELTFGVQSDKTIQDTTKQKQVNILDHEILDHEPRKLIELLNKFGSQNDLAKFSTHIWDGDEISSYADFISDISHKRYYKNFAGIQNYNKDIWYRKIYPFLFQKKLSKDNLGREIHFRWGVHKIKIGWQYPSTIADWCKENTNSDGKWTNQPFNMNLAKEFQPEKRINGKSVTSFYDVVELFKKEIEFKEDDLYLQIRKLKSELLPNFNIDATKLKSLRSFVVYNNTEIIMKAIKRIFKNITERSNKNNCNDIEVSTTFNGADKFYELKIVHVHSESYTPLNHKKFSSSGGDLTTLRETLFGLCDFSVRGVFIEGDKRIFAQIDYLYDGCQKINKEYLNPKQKKITEDPRGFNYILKFYT